ncbi:hypothetical protein J8273_5230 [Carpediemonas membranifera]|uniref:Uncharacterized protein n=1 Tax=Carpediemonas membranifera TaxID=201153 RepID=A0A8J6E8Q4_9EUKA|nr:hypothetical protein J8273_5230 [Carpediemonas membranifera]|eukprot:KAG9392245.1 hypothetical protein J8273_5230 [Carpediemonas membranifera]
MSSNPGELHVHNRTGTTISSTFAVIAAPSLTDGSAVFFGAQVAIDNGTIGASLQVSTTGYKKKYGYVFYKLVEGDWVESFSVMPSEATTVGDNCAIAASNGVFALSLRVSSSLWQVSLYNSTGAELGAVPGLYDAPVVALSGTWLVVSDRHQSSWSGAVVSDRVAVFDVSDSTSPTYMSTLAAPGFPNDSWFGFELAVTSNTIAVGAQYYWDEVYRSGCHCLRLSTRRGVG